MSADPKLEPALRGFRRTLRYVRPHLRPQRKFVAGGLLALAGEVAFRLLEPWPLKIVIDSVIVPATTGRGGANPFLPLLAAAVAVVAFAGFRAASAYLMTVCFAIAGSRAMTTVRADLFAHVQRLSLRFHGHTKTGDLLTRLVSDVNRVQEVAVTAALPLVGNVVALLSMTAVMFVLNWQLALVVVTVFPTFLLMSTWQSSRINGAARQQRLREGELAGTAGEALSAIRVVQAYSLEPVLQQAFSANNTRALRDGVVSSRLAAGLERRTDLLVGFGTALVLLTGGAVALSGALTVGELVVFLTYLKSAFKPMRDLAKYTGRLAKAAASGERIVDLFETHAEVADRRYAWHAPRFTGDVRFEDVDVHYGPGAPAVSGVDLHVPAGTRVALLGRSGSGKSTLASLVPRLQDPTGGRVRIDGYDVRDLTVASLRSQVAIVLQETVLFATTVRENIRYGRPSASDAQVEHAARLANADEFVTLMPQGYDTIVGERGESMSGGQRQRIAIARAILKDAPIVILDEATTGLDDENSRGVLDALRELTEGRTTFVISHDETQVADCTMVVRLADGQVTSVDHTPRHSAFAGRPC
ncbi:MAG: ATP-binding cassette domain-containing protein [Streptosporangiales bacterium]|nr:ATP-binding cassette domain-containing protein [Streptosporangiales bacterium]